MYQTLGAESGMFGKYICGGGGKGQKWENHDFYHARGDGKGHR
jgi:hypothetical protein